MNIFHSVPLARDELTPTISGCSVSAAPRTMKIFQQMPYRSKKTTTNLMCLLVSSRETNGVKCAVRCCTRTNVIQKTCFADEWLPMINGSSSHTEDADTAQRRSIKNREIVTSIGVLWVTLLLNAVIRREMATELLAFRAN